MDLTPILILLAALVCSAKAYSKYGRTCKDIGCLPSESCVIIADSCSWGQQDGKECGSYPTCKKTSTMNTNHSPGTGSSGAPENTVTHRPFSPPPSNTGGSNNPSAPIPSAPIPSAPNPSPPNPNAGGHIYPSIPNSPSVPNYPANPNNYPGFDPNGNRKPSEPNPYNPYSNRDRDPYGGRDPYNGNKNGGSSSDSGGSSLGGLLNFLRGGGSGTRYGSGGSNGLNYGDIFNALAGGGNRGSSTGGSGFSDILNTFGNRGGGGIGGSSFGGTGNRGGSGLTDILFGRGGSGNSGSGGFGGNSGFGGGSSNDRGYEDRNRQPSPSSGSSDGGGFLSTLSGLFGRQVADSLVRNALSGNRGDSSGGSGSGGSGGGGSDFFNSLRYGGLFNENTGHGDNKPKVTVPGAGPGGYPTQTPLYPNQAQAYQPQSYPANNPNQNIQNRNLNYNGASQSQTQSTQKPQPYGWSVGQH